MPILVRHVPTQQLYILLGTTQGLGYALRNNFPLEAASASFESKSIVVADAHGDIHWIPSIEFVVDSIDGVSCREALQKTPNSASS